MSSTITNATSSAISIFPNSRHGNSQSHSQSPSQTHPQTHTYSYAQRRTTVAATATKPVPMVGVGVGGVGVGVDIDLDYDMSMSMGMGMGVGMGMNMGMTDMHMGSYRGMDMDIAMSSEDQHQQHLMSWSPRPTNSFQNRFYPAASPGSLFNPIAMPAPNLSSSPIPIHSRKSISNAITFASAKSSKINAGSSSKHTRHVHSRRASKSAGGGNGNGDGEGEGADAEDGVEGEEEEDIDRDSEAPNSLTVSTQGGNYVCCGITLPDLHALVDHFENAHVQVFASPSLEALSGIGMGVHPAGVSTPQAPVASAISSNGNISTSVSVKPATATATSSTASATSPYEFPAPPFDTDDMDISLSDDGPSPSPPLTPATTPSPTTSAFDPIRVVYHHHPAGVNVGMGGVGSGAGVGVGAAGYGMSNIRGTGATFTMGSYGMGSQYLSPNAVLSVSSSAAGSAASTGSAAMPLSYFRPSTYSSLAGGNGPTMNMNASSVTAAFNRYAGYSDYSSQLPGTDPSPTYPYTTSASVGKLHGGASSGTGSGSHLNVGMNDAATAGYNAATASTSSCLSPALLFSSSAEPSPLNTPSSSRTGSPVEGQTPTHGSHTRSTTNTLPKGTLPLHPSSSASGSASASGSTSVAPSRRTPPPSSLPSTATVAGSSSSSASNHHPLSKPFKCPKPGCNKSYKQQNGLKYHLSHGQCNFAPRDPEVEKLSEQEREKRMRPFVCKVPVAVPSGTAGATGGSGSASASAGGGSAAGVNGVNGGGVYVECGRRYKNMNGLRYHYQHTGEHGAIGLEMLAQGRHPLPDLPLGYNHSHTNSSSSSSSLSRSNSKSGLSTPTSPSALDIPASTTTTTSSNTIVLPAINTSVLSPPSSSSTSASTPILSSASSPHASPSPILSVPPTPITPSPISPHPHPLRISSSSFLSSSSASVSMPPSPSRFNSGMSVAHGGVGIGAGTGVGGGNGFAALGGKSMSYPSSPVTSTTSVPVSPFSTAQSLSQHMMSPYPSSAYGYQYPSEQ